MEPIDLAKDQFIVLRDVVGARISCQRGILWITQVGRHVDDFLMAAEALEVPHVGVVLIEARKDALVEIYFPG